MYHGPIAPRAGSDLTLEPEGIPATRANVTRIEPAIARREYQALQERIVVHVEALADMIAEGTRLIDAMAGDPDIEGDLADDEDDDPIELDGDELDTTGAEDEIASGIQCYVPGPGCPLADPGPADSGGLSDAQYADPPIPISGGGSGDY